MVSLEVGVVSLEGVWQSISILRPSLGTGVHERSSSSGSHDDVDVGRSALIGWSISCALIGWSISCALIGWSISCALIGWSISCDETKRLLPCVSHKYSQLPVRYRE